MTDTLTPQPETKPEKKNHTLLILALIFFPITISIFVYKFLRFTKMRCWFIITTLNSILSIMFYRIATNLAHWTDTLIKISTFDLQLWVLLLLLTAALITTAAVLTITIMRSTFRKV